jgi:hypothetical protein
VSLTPGLASVEDLYHKLERESYRAYHTVDRVHKLDHFFNFCVTAHSLRDFYFERKGIVLKAQRALLHDQWNSDPTLRAAADIANSSKHLVLRSPDGSPRAATTKRVHSKRAGFVEFWSDGEGLLAVPVTGPDILITLKDGASLALHLFTARVLRTWQTFLRTEGIRVTRLSTGQLIPQPSIQARLLAAAPARSRPRKRPLR